MLHPLHRQSVPSGPEIIARITMTRLEISFDPSRLDFEATSDLLKATYWASQRTDEINRRAFRRLASDEIAGSVANWRLEGPQTWEERKHRRIERTRPFGHNSARA